MENIYSFTIGDIQCWAISDGTHSFSAATLFANAPAQELSQVLRRYDLKPDYIPTTLTCLLIKTATNIVLVDTGHGLDAEIGGQLLTNLQRAGFNPEDIDSVILTHVHPDHVAGCVDAAGELTFQAAAHYMMQDEWNFWTTETNLEKVSPWESHSARHSLPPLAGRLKLLDRETEIIPGITIVPAVGHTAGNSVVEVKSGEQTLLAIGDAALHAIQVEYPSWNMLLDQLPEQTVAARHALYKRAAEQNALVLAFHFIPFPSLGHITRQDGSWQWTPIKIQ